MNESKKQSDATPVELSLGMIARGRRGNAWLKAAALSFAVAGCALDVDPREARHGAAVTIDVTDNPECDNPDNPDNPDCPVVECDNPDNPDNPDCPVVECDDPDNPDCPVVECDNPDNPDNPDCPVLEPL